MAFRDSTETEPSILLLQRSLERGRLAHAYLFSGHSLDELEAVARNLTKTLNCRNPLRRGGVAVDACDACISCKKIDHDNHADVFWVRPESKSRQIRISQLVRRDDSPPRVLLDAVNLKPTESDYKVGIIVAADRMNEQAANAFLKTLEEPPARSVLILLTTEPQRLLETILSRCLRLSFGGDSFVSLPKARMDWLQEFSQMAVTEQKSLIGRYRLLDVLLKELARIRTEIDAQLTARSPIERYPDVENNLREKWQDELKAAIEADYRRQRAELLGLVQWWLRDVWVHCLESSVGGVADRWGELLRFRDLSGAKTIAARMRPAEAANNLAVMEQLQRWLGTNVQEALALEVALLKLRL